MHRHDISHDDISKNNILYEENQNGKKNWVISDFGFVCLLDDKQRELKLEEKCIKQTCRGGTLAGRGENFKNTEVEHAKKLDIASLGMILIKFFTNEFIKNFINEFMINILNKKIENIRKYEYMLINTFLYYQQQQKNTANQLSNNINNINNTATTIRLDSTRRSSESKRSFEQKQKLHNNSLDLLNYQRLRRPVGPPVEPPVEPPVGPPVEPPGQSHSIDFNQFLEQQTRSDGQWMSPQRRRSDADAAGSKCPHCNKYKKEIY